AMSHDGPIERKADQRGGPVENGLQPSLSDLERTVQLDLDLLVRPRDLPWVGATKPVVGLLPLPAVLEGLTEYSVLVPQPVPHGRNPRRARGGKNDRRPSPAPPFPSPASGSSSMRLSQSRVVRVMASPRKGLSSRFSMLLVSERPIRNSIDR